MTQPALAEHVPKAGRHYRHPVTGDLVPSVTNIIDVLNKPAIPKWAAKSVAETAWRMRHSLPEMAESEAVDMLKGSPWSKSDRAADRGSSIHEWLQAQALDEEPPELSPDAEAYRPGAQAFLDTWQPEFVHTEVTIWGDGYAGTADFIAKLSDAVVLGDYKTSKAIYPEVALQLAALRHGHTIVSEHGEQPLPHIDRCVAVLITTKGHEVYPVAAGQAVMDAFRGALALWNWRTYAEPVGKPWSAQEAA